MASRSASSGKSRFAELEKRIGYHFSDYGNLERALTHASGSNSAGRKKLYERLEFLGDRVLGLCVSERLFHEFPDADEGELALRFNTQVSGNALADLAEELKIAEFVRTSLDLSRTGEKRGRRLLADVMESIIAAIYLDGGLDAAKDFLDRVLDERIHQPDAARRDSKTALQEWAHAKQLGTPKYRETGKSGPDHEPVFTVEVKVKGKIAGHGSGRSKRVAEQAAAREILIREGIWQDE